MTSPILAIDLGKTGCRGSLRFGGRQIRGVEAAGAPGLASAGGVSAAEDAIRAVVERVAPATAFVLSVGAAGAASAPEAAALLARRLAEGSGANAVAVTSDAVTAHAGALGGSAGVVLAIGTGAVATAVDDAGRFTRVDGWGPLLGDEGSGGWIGLEGLRAVLRAHDGRGPRTALVDAIGGCYGVGPEELPNLLGQQDNPASTAARFAPAVAAAAATDETAAAIMSAAGHALGRSVLAAVERSGLRPPVPCAVTGGLVNLGAALLDPLDAMLERVVDRRAPLGLPIDGAALLAVEAGTALEGLVTRIG
ncbi:BadF/BadG/BcrA/BcrD ATPase family protein [Nocardia sp. CDC153]|uniref:BadF/BadG/BcrA/BcrD ATPase family protein n=1 Tax=Nocardia sp. CDC153 TaxID=3112167 RepID=UPI002DBC332F|nr:BadF/BadG/BcrA/BcrD ATPase family protein [Nocardia sp. CDC153]MEC3952582.1 BadF/BadG/BcrA/BcrD ATPase family protein [Nocardia sp. CDC153]